MEKALLFSVLLFGPTWAFFRQFVGIRGQLSCGKVPLQTATVTLWNKKLIGSDSEMARTVTDRNGAFEIQGNDTSLLSLNVLLRVSHHCKEKQPCRTVVDLPVPSEFITRSDDVTKWFPAGHLNMAYRFPDETRACDKF
ncbi:unnamed protein product [Nippostrongylus brasiliensis]|uniref:Transthyretin-like family protein n=1 Tax=Nippostrongylus brasiliensis TaxID=27835 RepID=A0A0N4XMG8_NIPBR|nr:unnamed protein product [Nippostrongylus brasiliensis]